MATEPQKSKRQNKYRCFSTITLGGNEIRFIGMNERNNGVHFPSDVNNCAGRLLFVAVDVMCSSKLSKKNYQRVVCRFSKLGVAIRMKLSGFKIEGINNSSVIWFFSVQGLFHVAFDLGNMAFQRDCLSQLQDVWLKRYEDPLLPEEGVLCYHKRLCVAPQNCLLNATSNLIKERKARKLLGRLCYYKNVIISCESSDENEIENLPENIEGASYVLEHCDIPVSQTVMSCYCGLVPCDCRNEGRREGNNSPGHQTEIQNPQTNCSESMEAPSHSNESYTSHKTTDFRETITKLIQSLFGEDDSLSLTELVLIVFEYLKYFKSKNDTADDKCFGFILFRIMEEFLSLSNIDCDQTAIPGNTFGISNDKFIFLNLVSEWLGKEYHYLEGAIKQTVESFKTENITCIDSLPSAETITDTLFPSFMKTFVYNWLGYSSDDSVIGAVQSNTMFDHCYTSESNRHITENINYDLLQLILEFGSNCLISGIGHVVYSRLQIQNRTR